MAFSTNFKASCIAGVIVTLLLVSIMGFAKADIRACNNCDVGLTVFTACPSCAQIQYNLPAHTTLPLNVGSPWVGGVIWASPHANPDREQCTLFEFNVNPPVTPDSTVSTGRDFYDVSVVNAYNLPAMIQPTSLVPGDASNGLECGTVECVIGDAALPNVCQVPNSFAGPDDACINVNGPGLQDVPSIQSFRNVCPQAYTQSNNNTGVVYGCNTGADYDAIWCP